MGLTIIDSDISDFMLYFVTVVFQVFLFLLDALVSAGVFGTAALFWSTEKCTDSSGWSLLLIIVSF